MDLLSELLSEEDPGPCAVRDVLSQSFEDYDAQEVHGLLTNEAIPVSRAIAFLRRKGLVVPSETTVRRHRRGDCTCEPR